MTIIQFLSTDNKRYRFYVLIFTFISHFVLNGSVSRPLLEKACLLSDNSSYLDTVRFKRPDCFADWQRFDIDWIRTELKQSINFDLHFISNRENQTCKKHFNSFPLSGKGSQDWWPHMAHVSEILFYFYSTVLWQPLVYNTEIPCVYTLSIGEDNKIWNTTESGLHSHYIKQLLSTIETEWKLKIVQPKSCLNALILPSNASASDPDILSSFAPPAALFSEENSWPLGNFYPPLWLLHPTDSLQLGSSVLNSPPCQWHNQAAVLLDSSLHILVLNRHKNRQILNINMLLELLANTTLNNRSISIISSRHGDYNSSLVSPTNGELSSSSSTTVNISRIESKVKHTSESPVSNDEHSASVTYFEKKSFHQQAKIMRSSDIFINVHGAAMTNIVFLKPCSIVIEVFPWSYHSPEYYSGLAKRAGLIYYEWQEHYRNTDLFIDKESENRCADAFNKVLRISKYNIDGGATLNQADSDRANSACFGVENCRMCAQQWAIKGITVSLDKLSAALQDAVIQRKRCIASNPYYNASYSSFPTSSSTVSYYPFSQKDPLRDGLTIRSSSSREVYLLEGGKKRPFSGGRSFLSRGFDFDQVHVITDPWIFNRIPMGDVL